MTTTDHRTEAARLLAPAAPDPIDVVARLLAERDELAAKVRELEDRPVLTAQALAGAISAAHDDAVARWDTDGCRRQGATMTMIAGADVMRHLGPVTLPAQDRAEELARLIAVEPIRTGEWKALVERTRSALASLGAPAMRREVDNTRTAAREKRNADACTIHYAPLATCGCPHGEGAWIEYRKLWIAARSEVAKLMGDRSAAKPADTVANRAGIEAVVAHALHAAADAAEEY